MSAGRMKELAELLGQALATATFRTSGGTSYSTKELRQALSQARGSVSETLKVLTAHPQVDDDWLGSVADPLRDRLSGYIDAGTDRIGHSFHVLGDAARRFTYTADGAQEIHSSSSLSGLAKGLIRAAAVLGPDRVARLLDSWADGEPRHYKICVVLAGVHVDDTIELDRGLRVYRLPVSSDSLPISMPDMQSDRVSRILGHTVLEIDAYTHPAFFVPAQDDEAHTPLHTRTALGEVSLETFFLALSLVCNRRVGLAWSWSDYGDASSFTTGVRSGLSGPGMPTETLSKSRTYEPSMGITELTSFVPPAPNLCEKGLRRAWELRSELQRRIDSDQRFQIAVTRWAQAASPGTLNPDRVIDLRIALEALYLNSSEGELGFRLSVTGARHLGSNLDDRKPIRKTLADFYRLASRVIHGAALAGSANASLVDKATTHCQDGILKIVEERHQPDWTDVLLS